MIRTAASTASTPVNSDAVALIEQLLSTAIEREASDVHLEPTTNGFEIRLRIDGLLTNHAVHATDVGRSLVARLMVMAQLLTYRTDVPQEGRIHWQPPAAKQPMNLRLSIMPTTHGLRAAVRMPADLIRPRSLDQLGLPAQVHQALVQFARSEGGMLLVTGPAGSGKTTTIYALLEHIALHQAGQSIIALEDPVERDLPGVTQIEVSPFGQLTYERALRSILRQDPQVLMLGEIRDAETASLATQAALSGHRMICTLHAATPSGAISRLLEMGLETYRITSAIQSVISQRLLRRLNESHNSPGAPEFRGRVPAAEVMVLNTQLRSAILSRTDAERLQQLAAGEPGYATLRDSAIALVADGLTTLDEVDRVLGSREPLKEMP